jgi:hypothetical protein
MRLLQVCTLLLLLPVGADLSDPGTPGVFSLEREELFQQAVTRLNDCTGGHEHTGPARLAVAFPHHTAPEERIMDTDPAGTPTRVTPARHGGSVRSARRELQAAPATISDLEER